MLCEKCKKNKATVLYKQVINGVASSVSLCSKCAPATSFGFGGDINLFGGLFENAVRSAVPEVKCNLCGATYADIAREGKVGCAKCYEIFADRLRGSIERIHGAVRHVADEDVPREGGGDGGASDEGRLPQSPEATAPSESEPDGGADALAGLKAALAAAIAEERYEDAARIRDEIKATEESNGH